VRLSSSNDWSLEAEASAAIPSPVPGQIVGQPGRAVGPPAPTTFQNPYRLLEPVRPPVVNPNGNPYGLAAPATTTPPPGPIRKSGTDGGQGPA